MGNGENSGNNENNGQVGNKRIKADNNELMDGW